MKSVEDTYISHLTDPTHEILSISGNVDIETGTGVGRLPGSPASCVGCVSVIAATLTRSRRHLARGSKTSKVLIVPCIH
jgi:hypothetical protein